MRSPSVESLKKELKIPLGTAQLIKQAAYHNKPKTALKLANEAMKGYGVETLYPEYPRFYYVNMGDTYSKTLYYNGTSLMIGSWGDYVETHRGVAHDGSNPRDSKYWR